MATGTRPQAIFGSIAYRIGAVLFAPLRWIGFIGRNNADTEARPIVVAEPSLPANVLREMDRRIQIRFSHLRLNENAAHCRIQPNWWTNLKDRLYAFYSAKRQRHEYSKVLAGYHAKIEQRLRYRVRRFLPPRGVIDALINDTEKKISGLSEGLKDALAERQTLLEGQIDHHTVMVKELQDTAQSFGSDTQLSAVRDFEVARDKYNAWCDALQRPAFSEDFKELSSDYQDKRITHYRVGRQKIEHARFVKVTEQRRTLRERLDNIRKYIPPLFIFLIPAEIGFSLPAFRELIPGDVLGAITGAIIFTAVLAQLGYAVGVFLARTLVWRIDPRKKGQEEGVSFKVSRSMVAIAALLTVIAIGAAGLGASLRSMVPEIKYTQRELMTTISAPAQIDRGDDFFSSGNSINKSQEDSSRLRRQRLRQLLADPIRFIGTTDGWLGFMVYLALFIMAALNRYLKVDPVFPFELAAADYAAHKQFIELELIEHKRTAQVLEMELHALKDEITRLTNSHFPGRPRLLEIQKEVEFLENARIRVNDLQSRMDEDIRRVLGIRTRRFYENYLENCNRKTRTKILERFRHELNECLQDNLTSGPIPPMQSNVTQFRKTQ